ncbi:hypothetical protein [Sphingopyxis sp. R3-92]|uniref:hypothetical protein n=1 Tax=Sphingopyxis sp. R3-92 TaxID=3158553 RepID=UPI003EE7AA93
MSERTLREEASCGALPQKLGNRGSIDAGYTDCVLSRPGGSRSRQSSPQPDRGSGDDRCVAAAGFLMDRRRQGVLPPDAAGRHAERCKGMNLSDKFLMLAGQELQFVSDLIIRIDQGLIDPVGLDREAAVLLLREVADERRRLVDRLKSDDDDSGAAWTGAPV